MTGQNIAIIGGGVVGLASALRLAQNGHRVALFDPAPPGSGSSAGNPGGISTSSTLPAASPGVIRKVPGWVTDPDGPLRIRPAHLPRMGRWLARFVVASGAGRFDAGVRALSGLTRGAVPAWADLLGGIGAGHMLQDSGTLVVYRGAAAHAAETASWDRRARLGLRLRDMAAEELHATVPELSRAYDRARLVTDNAQLSDPKEVTGALLTAFVTLGGTVRQVAVRGLTPLPDGIRLTWADGTEVFDRAVICAGARSAPLAAQLGDRVPLQPERGYSLTYGGTGIALRQPVFSPSEKIMAAPVGHALRFAGTAEFAGFDTPPDWRRADSLARLGRQMFPALSPDAEPARWTGDRPSTPDGLPVLGVSSRSERVIHAFGHGHIGMTTAAVTADALVTLVAGNTPDTDLAPFAPARFRGW